MNQFFVCHRAPLSLLCKKIHDMIYLRTLTKRLSQFLTLALFLGFAAVAQAQWDVMQFGGRDYISLDSIKKFYNFKTYKRSGNQINLEGKNLIFKLRVGDQEATLNGVKFVFTYPVIESGSKTAISRIDLTKLIDPVLRPSYIANAGNFRTVVLDAGHGGKDAGAVNAYNTEKSYNLRVAQEVQKLLTAKGYKVILTRNSDVYLTLQQRVDIANSLKESAIFISIHFNSGGRSARGIETFTLSPQGVAHYGSGFKPSDNTARNGNMNDSANVALATAVHSQVLMNIGTNNTFDRGIKRARFSVLTGVRHPAILLEGGFMSHPYEARLMENPKYISAVARGVANAVILYKGAVSYRKPGARPQ
jgi:N-acetylmuramoyl-L-alanine amidase